MRRNFNVLKCLYTSSKSSEPIYKFCIKRSALSRLFPCKKWHFVVASLYPPVCYSARLTCKHLAAFRTHKHTHILLTVNMSTFQNSVNNNRSIRTVHFIMNQQGCSRLLEHLTGNAADVAADVAVEAAEGGHGSRNKWCLCWLSLTEWKCN